MTEVFENDKNTDILPTTEQAASILSTAIAEASEEERAGIVDAVANELSDVGVVVVDITEHAAVPRGKKTGRTRQEVLDDIEFRKHNRKQRVAIFLGKSLSY